MVQMVKNLPAVQETWVQFLGHGDLLEKEMATHSSILAWRIPWTEEPVGLQFMGSQRPGHDWRTNTFTLRYTTLTTTIETGKRDHESIFCLSKLCFSCGRQEIIDVNERSNCNIRWIIEEVREFQKNIYFSFIDMPKPLTVWITINCGKFWKMGIPDHLTCLLRHLYAGWEATVKTGHGTTDWFQIGKGVRQGFILSPCLFNFYAAYIMWNAGLDEAQAGIKIARRNINNFRYADDTTLMAEGEEELKSLLMKMKEEREKIGLKLNIQKTKIMASSLITSWQIDGERMETVRDFIFLGSKITADGDCSHEIKRCLLLGRKVMVNLDSTLKSRDITLPTKVHLVKAVVFPVVMYGCESWTLKKAECRRIHAFELWCWRRLLRAPWTVRRSN